MDKYIPNNEIKDKILDITLPKQVCFKEEDGDPSPSQKRHGRIDVIYKNRKVINTRNGKTPFIPRVKVYFYAYANDNTIFIIDIYDAEMKSVLKKFVIKSSLNDYTISDMKDLFDDVKNILERQEDKDSILISLIEFIREYTKNDVALVFDEFAQ